MINPQGLPDDCSSSHHAAGRVDYHSPSTNQRSDANAGCATRGCLARDCKAGVGGENRGSLTFIADE
jgi:hypothetical protein